MKDTHVSVLTKEIMKMLSPKRGEVVVDATYGAGGHSAVLKRPGVKLLTIDADPAAGAEVTGNFGDIGAILENLKIKKVNKALFDLGWNRGQLHSGRGFSFMHDEPLQMSYGEEARSGFMAADILNTWSEKALADVFFGYGEERYARKIARAIVLRRKFQPFKTTIELVEVVGDAVPPSYRHGRINPATKTFQALRIAVNDELRTLEQGLTETWRLLACDGRIAVITFHSIEDRLVKNIFKKIVAKGGARLLTKKPLAPSQAEIVKNPSARSAKLRVIEKICTP